MLPSNPFHVLWTECTLLCAAVPRRKAVQGCNNPEMPRSSHPTPPPPSASMLWAERATIRNGAPAACALTSSWMSKQWTAKVSYAQILSLESAFTHCDDWQISNPNQCGQLHFSFRTGYWGDDHSNSIRQTWLEQQAPSIGWSFTTNPGQSYKFSSAQQCQCWPKVFHRQLLMLVAGCFSEH